jgi:hypothetical protein
VRAGMCIYFVIAFFLHAALSPTVPLTHTTHTPCSPPMQQLLVKYPRDFKNIPTVTDYGKGSDVEANKSEEMVSSPPAHDHMLASHFFCSSPAALNASPLPSTPTCPLSSPLRGAGVWPGSGLALKVAGVARASEMHPPLTAVLGAGPCVPSNFEILTDVDT